MVPMPKYLNKCSEHEIRNFLKSISTVLFDCDGVLWLENEVLPDSQHTVNKLLEAKKSVFYVTNNNSKTREEFLEKFQQLNFNAVKDNIVSTSFLAADYLKSLNFNKKVYVMGSEGITKELDKVGIKYLKIGPDVVDTTLQNYIQKKLELDPEVGAVLLGFDQHFSYPKMVKAATYLSDPRCHFIATCTDETFPVKSKLTYPGTGCFVKCLEAATGRKAFVVGKPNDYMKTYIMRMGNINPATTLMVGDRCNTDILFGKRCGFQTLLVLTGVTSLSDVKQFADSTDAEENDLVPQYCIDKLGDLLPYIS